MIKLLFTILSLFISNYCLSQYYVVNDPDSFVNVREEPNVNAKTIKKLSNETIVFESFAEDADEKSNWMHVDFYIKKTSAKKDPEDYTPGIMKGFIIQSGYVYKTKLIAIEKLKPLKNKQLVNGYSCFNDSIKLTVTIAPFVRVKHTLQYSKINDGILERVDNQPMIGTDGDMPQDEIKGIKFSLHNNTITIPASACKNLFNPSRTGDAYTGKDGTIYLVMYNSDAAGSYSCIFVFKNGRFIQRLVFAGEC